MSRPTPALAEEPRVASRRAPPGARLLWEADALLALVPQLRATGFVANLAQLREKLAAMLRDFQLSARSDGVEAPRVAQATEVLTALIDHVVTSMPWGADAGWPSLAAATVPAGSARTVQSAGQRLLELARASSGDEGMRELIAVVLELGFDGASARDAHIPRVRAELSAHDAPHGEPLAHDLSPQWRSSVERGSAFMGWLPLWVSSLVAGAALAALYLALQLSLAAMSDRLYARLATLRGPAVVAPQVLPAPQPRLAGFLAEEAAARELAVRDEIDRSVIAVPGAQLFEAGSATLQPGGTQLLRPIAAALQRAPGKIQVIGHTDGPVTRTARYPSDWDLSVERARVVQEALRGLGVEATRLSYDGRAGVEPLAAAGPGSPATRDGRVEIVLLAGRS